MKKLLIVASLVLLFAGCSKDETSGKLVFSSTVRVSVTVSPADFPSKSLWTNERTKEFSIKLNPGHYIIRCHEEGYSGTIPEALLQIGEDKKTIVTYSEKDRLKVELPR